MTDWVCKLWNILPVSWHGFEYRLLSIYFQVFFCSAWRRSHVGIKLSNCVTNKLLTYFLSTPSLLDIQYLNFLKVLGPSRNKPHDWEQKIYCFCYNANNFQILLCGRYWCFIDWPTFIYCLIKGLCWWHFAHKILKLNVQQCGMFIIFGILLYGGQEKLSRFTYFTPSYRALKILTTNRWAKNVMPK
jgi:hypothetical protein